MSSFFAALATAVVICMVIVVSEYGLPKATAEAKGPSDAELCRAAGGLLVRGVDIGYSRWHADCIPTIRYK